MSFRKTTSAALIFCAISSTALAGGMSEPIFEMAPEDVAVAPSSSSAEILIPLIVIALIALAASGAGDGGDTIVETFIDSPGF